MCSLSSSQRIGAIGLREFMIDFVQGSQVSRHRRGVPSSDRPGEGRLTPLQGVLQSGAR
jgi:hypothetical protein